MAGYQWRNRSRGYDDEDERLREFRIRNRGESYDPWETDFPERQETGYWAGAHGQTDRERRGAGYEFGGQREYDRDFPGDAHYPSYRSQYGRDRDFGHAGSHRTYGDNRSHRSYAPGYGEREFDGGYRRNEPRGFGGFDQGGWGDNRRTTAYTAGNRHDRSGRYTEPDPRTYGLSERYDNERGWWDRAADEVSSWFGDEEAERRREWDELHSKRGRGPKGYKRNDERIREDISDRLTDDHYLDASDIEVSVKNGEVTLSGTVDSRTAKYRAEMFAESCSGVVEVQNNLRAVRSTDSPSTSAGNTPGSTTRTKSGVR